MRTILFATFMILGWNINAQISINPDKIKEKTKKELNRQTQPKEKKSKTNNLNQSTQTNRKRPGGTLQSTPASSGKKEETPPTPRKEGGNN
jgi:hypothetical protein